MYNFKLIGTIVLIFVLFVLTPIILNAGSDGHEKPDPSLDTPEINKLEEKKCVESKDYMRREHMQLLDEWRDQALRDGNRVFKNDDGRSFDISLQNSCLKCHSNKKDFCDECHNYLAVKPYCWDCHLTPDEIKEKKL